MHPLVPTSYDVVWALVALLPVVGLVSLGRSRAVDGVQTLVWAAAEYGPVVARGRRMLLDTRFGAPAGEPGGSGAAGDLTTPALRLGAMRDRLVLRYPAIGPTLA